MHVYSIISRSTRTKHNAAFNLLIDLAFES
jgi:hypothetical protein